MKVNPSHRWFALTGGVLLGLGVLTWGIAHISRSVPPAVSASETEVQPEEPREVQEAKDDDTKIQVRVVRPTKGQVQRLSTQPGSVQAYESVGLFAKVPGFLKKQTVDIGDRVKSGQVLAVVDVPELEAQLKRNVAGVKQAESHVKQMKASVDSAKADMSAAKASVKRAVAAENSAQAWVRFRALQYQRMKDLFATKSIEERLVEESKEHLEASRETELSAKETITANEAKVDASRAKIEQAKADVEAAEAEVEVARAEVEKVQAQISFATICAPFDGVVTARTYFVGAYIRSANEGGNNEPLMTVKRTDLFRVIVQIPDRDVPFTDPGDPAEVQVDALPGKRFPAKVSRVSNVEDSQTRLMRVEIDLPNPTGQIRAGMYGQVTIILDQEKDKLSVPSSCLVGKHSDGTGTVYVVRDGHARQVAVRLGADNGLRVAVLEGLHLDDQVILNPGNALSEDTEVIPTVVN